MTTFWTATNTKQSLRFRKGFMGEFFAPGGKVGNLYKIGAHLYQAVMPCEHGGGFAVAQSAPIFSAHIKRIGGYHVSASRYVARFALVSH